jgi:hypothetical protein
MDDPALIATVKAAIDIFVGLSINHSWSSAERERASA